MQLGSGSVITLIVDLVIAGIIVYVVYLFLGMLSLPQPVRTMILLLFAVIAIVFLFGLFGIRI